MSHTIVWGDEPLKWQEVVQVARQGATLALSDNVWQRIAQCREIVGNIVAAG